VWIPRYRYELFNANFTSGTSPQTINIEFESATYEKSTGKIDDVYMNYEWYTHPAFSFGTEEEGYTELSGFWVAKFEPSSDVSCIATSNDSFGTGCNKTELNPRVLPGVTSWRGAQVSTQYIASQKFMDSVYLTETGMNQVDAHMMKNIEWGAVAYLSHSIYGKNAQITTNNTSDSNYYTGGGSGTAYITNVAQSTTGNVYGIYDANGKAWEKVMGNLNNTAGSSGFTMSNIESKYIDIYTGTSVSASILGDALGETAGWYSDYTTFVSSTGPWFYRGGNYYDGDLAGAFAFYGSAGEAGAGNSFRPVLSAK